MLTAAGHTSFDNDPWILRLVDFTKDVLAQDRVRLIGICFGHQIIGRALGVTVGRNTDGWEVSVCKVDLTAKGKELFEKDSLVSDHYIRGLGNSDILGAVDSADASRHRG